MICLKISRCWVVCVLVGLAVMPSWAQSGSPRATDWDGHLVWVLPFENNSTQPGLDWIGASFPDILNSRLSSAGLLTIRREDRRYAMQHLGLPADFHPTQATSYRIAQTLDADYVVFGSYTVANGRIQATARILDMHGPSMGATLQQQGNLDQLINIEDELAWKLAMQIDPKLNLQEQTFLAASRNLRLDAFENYIRGLVEPGVEERIGHLTKAVQLSPGYVKAWFALGQAYFDNQQYDQAEAAFARVPKGGRLSLEAMFYSGLSDLYTGNYARAQTSFASIASVLPLPEVLTNEGIAFNRRGQNGTAFFRRVVEMNPQSADYWFNLAVSERRQKNYTAALNAVARCLTLHPQDEEAQNLRRNLTMLKSGQLTATPAKPAPAATNASADQSVSNAADDQSDSDEVAKDKPDVKNEQGASSSPSASLGSDATSPDYEPLERIARTYDETSLRQGAFALEQMNAMKLRSMPPTERAQRLCQQGRAFVNDGLLLEAERQFQLALAADPNSSAAYAGLAEVHEYAGSIKFAQQEANKSLQMQPSAAAYLVLARIALSQHALADARTSIENALRLEPNNTAAKGILQAIQAQQDQTK
ncbi:MAG TPA: tetratricopeptide repeat protein [Acidobacteriaceae bacterium]|nr:tetratricopeptide repeat protein [Acidobacteriaceae bacterium]